MAGILKMKMSADDDGSIDVSQVADPVEDLDIANKQYVDKLITSLLSDLVTIQYVIVQELPQTGSPGTIYFILNDSSESENVYDEYIYVNSSFEKLGSTTLDLSDYMLKTEATQKINTSVLDILAGEY